MSYYKIKVVRHYEYEVFVSAENGYKAREAVRDYEIEDLEPHEVKAYFDYEVVQ